MPGVCVVSQPTFLPWLGYFDLIDQADEFVFLDVVQFSKQSWQQRNRIVTSDGLAWLTVPIRGRGRSSQAIKDVEINEGTDFPRKLLRTLEQHYRRAPCFDTHYQPLANIIEATWSDGLGPMNIALIEHIVSLLGIDTRLHVASRLSVSGRRSDLLVEICRQVQSTRYVSAKGAEDYLAEDAGVFDRANIEVRIHEYEHPKYRQLHSTFVPYASVVDLLFNVGEESISVIRSGRKACTSLELTT